jgi:mobilization protein NikA
MTSPADVSSTTPSPAKLKRTPRGRRVWVRFSEAEYQALKARADEAGMTASALIRDHLGKVRVRNRADEGRRNELLNRINANLNMLARWVNTYKTALEAMPIRRRLILVEGQIARLIERMDATR